MVVCFPLSFFLLFSFFGGGGWGFWIFGISEELIKDRTKLVMNNIDESRVFMRRILRNEENPDIGLSLPPSIPSSIPREENMLIFFFYKKINSQSS